MEAVNVCDDNNGDGDDNNQENNPPFSVNETTPFLETVRPAKKTFRRRVRQPLDDITHRFKNSALSSLGEGNGSIAALPPLVSVSASNSRKRKAFEE
ncbi:hypothetical protein SADUNF_Sadunf13G0095200 [Salix dunnii]|uniref:Uncharacterized protein n=1 Tax=Salix dunnii TaxID=1413687 RepID=A0A835JI42_9ROSI|nr:hypothetical protein SADUNF_Sadunf13G0095200 [Salix dunnii]